MVASYFFFLTFDIGFRGILKRIEIDPLNLIRLIPA